MRRGLRIVILVPLLLISIPLAKTSQRHPGATFPGEGNEWLNWTEQDRSLFVAGFVVGASEGTNKACMLLAKGEWKSPDDNPFARCERSVPHYSHPLNLYTSRITQFYQDHPEYRKIPAYVVMTALPDEKDPKTVNLYELARSGNLMH